MYLGRCLVLRALVVLSLFDGIALSGGNVHPRQRTDLSVTTSTGGPRTSGSPNQASNSPSAAKPTNSEASGPNASSENAQVSGSLRGETPSETGVNAPAPTTAEGGSNSNVTTKPEDEIYAGGLPIHPKTTPGIAVAGVFLLLAGLPYCLIGIKIKFLHVFLSTALLSSLGITVLIVYVMNPPVKYAIQGAYVTAVTITGLLAGGLAVVFPEVTEALGCLLGGYCVSMWFLVLKPGGLVTSVYGKLIIIAAFCTALFALAFYRITRPYSLIFSLSFSGATTIVLGIDCFSRAGLKEFWLYIWGLNANIFPLETNDYPHTRGIRVEIAVIVLITGFGIMSQVKLWNILKERRATKDAEKRRQDADLEALDEDVGRRVEEEQKLERAQWEATFGRKKMDEVTVEERPGTGRISRADSGIGEEMGIGKRSGEHVEEFVETQEMRRGREEHIQMVQMQTQSADVIDGAAAKGHDISAQALAPVDVYPAGPAEDSVVSTDAGVLTPSPVSRRQSSQSSAGRNSNRSNSQRLSARSVSTSGPAGIKLGVPPPPKVVPLPIPIPVEADGDDDEVSSLATFAESNRQEVDEQAFGSTVRLVEHEEEDKASSLAATFDDSEGEMDNTEKEDRTERDLSFDKEAPEESPPSPPQIKIDADGAAKENPTSAPYSTENTVTPELGPVSENGSGKVEGLALGSDEDVSRQATPEKGLITESRLKDTSPPGTSVAVSNVDSPHTPPPSVSFVAPMKVTRLPADLAPASAPRAGPPSTPDTSPQPTGPAKCSKVVRNYRTNEWAKHLADAELPELETLGEYPGASDVPDEIPAPLHIEELQETATLKPHPAPNPIPKIPQPEPANPAMVPANHPQSHSAKLRPAIRTGSVPVVPVENVSPVDRALPGSRTTTPLPFAQNTLIGKRDNMVRSRQSFNALAEQGSSTPSPIQEFPAEPKHHLSVAPNMSFGSTLRHTGSKTFPQLPTSDNESEYHYRVSMLDDDMPLADRRNELLQHAIPQAGASPTPQPPHHRSLPQQVDRREAMLKNWRETVKTELQTSSHTTHAIQERRGEMLNERMQSIQNERHKNLKDNFRDEMFDERMRQKDMLNLHKEAMRRMQAGANKHI